MSGSQRLAMRVAYDGTDFVGWQRQPQGRSVQQVLEQVLGKLAGDRDVGVIGSGRTDSGVHARGQVAHVDMPTRVDVDELHHRVGRMLPNDIVVHQIVPVPDSFHARFHACLRRYEYSVIRVRDPFRTRFAWHVPGTIDVGLLEESAAHLVGTHDFTGLSKFNPDTPNTVCAVTSAGWESTDDGLVFEIAADRFLYGMVRLSVGIMMDIARGRRPPRDIRDVLESRDRNLQSSSAPARGLVLSRVEYPVSPFAETSA